MYDTPMPDDQLVQRLHELLARALRRSRPQPFDSPVTVAEIYQDLVPYRDVRTALGFQMNADYEHTLLRLLAGEDGLARLEPTEAREELRVELETPNPNVGLFRKFAGCDVWVTPGVAAGFPVHSEEAVPAPAPVPAGLEPAPDGSDRLGDTATWAGKASPESPTDNDLDEWESSLPELILDDVVPVDPASPEPTPPEPVSEPAPAPISHQPEATTMFEAPASPAPAAATASQGTCAFCASDLPVGRTVKFCPFCGADQALLPCGTCAEPLEPDWRFCIACGSRQDRA